MIFDKLRKKNKRSPEESNNTNDSEILLQNITKIVETTVRSEFADFAAQTKKDGKNIAMRLQELIAQECETVDTVAENMELTKEIAEIFRSKIKELDAGNAAMRKALIQNADMIEDFYLYAKKEGVPDIFGQAELMWANTCKTLAAEGITRIGGELNLFDPLLYQIQGTVCDERYANGIVTEVFRSGYIYGGKVLRKSTVVVNKLS